MRLFGSRIRLTQTSYGYLPPGGAVVWGWHCSSRECGHTEDEVPPRGWPFRCPRCRAPTDPAFAEPWKHEARGVEIRYLLAKGVDDGGFTANELYLWRHAEALRTGDAAGARAARREFRDSLQDDDDGFLRGFGYFSLVHASLEVGDLDAAAEDLLDWTAGVAREGQEGDAVGSHSYKQVVSSAIDFLDAPGAASHPRAGAIREGCIGLAEIVYPELPTDHQSRIVQMGREV